MPRAALTSTLVLGAVLAAGGARAFDAHVDPADVPGGCASCHAGHGMSRSPMLPAPVNEVCLRCHGDPSGRDAAVRRGDLAATARPPLLATRLTQPYGHPMTDTARTRDEEGAVTCTSCHSPHRGGATVASAMPGERGEAPRVSPRDPDEFEVDLCLRCHGTFDSFGPSRPDDVRRLVDTTSRSFHPVLAPGFGGSPSLRSGTASGRIDCSDCHGASGPEGPRGPHGSIHPFILRASYTIVDGQVESSATFSLCYRCHDRDAVLDSSLFPLHRVHVVSRRIACATCHNPHGSVQNRALIRFDETPTPASLSPSPRAGILAFESDGPGVGTCYVACHGIDHAPAEYGGVRAVEFSPEVR